MGGRITLLLAAHSADIAAASPYYGPVLAASPTNIAPMDLTEKIRGAVQGHYGGTDMNPKPDDVRAFYDKLKKTNAHAEFFIYQRAGHAFHSYSRPSYNPEAATSAWNRTLAFFQQTLK
jgi:carboxymethylenebutenolidase